MAATSPAKKMTIAPARLEHLELEIRTLFEEARRRRRRRWIVAGASVAMTLALVSGLWLSLFQGTRMGRAFTGSQRPKQVGTFAHPTGVVLVFADGLTLDLDHRAAVDRALPGQRAGDQRWAITQSGGSFVVGWGEVWANPIAGGPPRPLGHVVTYVPAAEPGAVWLVDYPGGRIGEGTPTFREVTVAGAVLRTELGPPPSSGVPIVGIQGGLAFETSSGIALWNADRQTFTRRLGSEPGFIGNAANGSVAWCEGNCGSLHVTAVAGADHAIPSPQPGLVFQPGSVRLSPNGRYVAAITTLKGLGTANEQGNLDVIDTRTGHVVLVRPHLSAWSTLTWTSDSKSVFFASETSSGMTVGDFQTGTNHEESAGIPIQNAESFVIVSRSEAAPLLRGAVHKSLGACPASAIGSPATRACGYTY